MVGDAVPADMGLPGVGVPIITDPHPKPPGRTGHSRPWWILATVARKLHAARHQAYPVLSPGTLGRTVTGLQGVETECSNHTVIGVGYGVVEEVEDRLGGAGFADGGGDFLDL